jgi:UTP:GlnB (protein PII) uridylyltransferase
MQHIPDEVLALRDSSPSLSTCRGLLETGVLDRNIVKFNKSPNIMPNSVFHEWTPPMFLVVAR